MRTKIRILKDVSRYLTSSYVSQGIDMFTAVLSRRFLGPSLMGIWAFCQVLINYAKYSALGASDAAVREVPYCLGKGDRRKAEEIQNAVFTMTTLNAVLLGIAVMISAAVFRTRFSREFFWGLVVVGGVIILQRIHNLLIVFLRAHKDFPLISKQIVLSSAVNCFLVFFLASKFQLYGYFGAVLLSYLFTIVYVQASRRFPLRYSLNWKVLKPVMELGLPLLLSGILTTFFFSIDKLAISHWLGLHSLGVYTLALMAHSYLNSMPNFIGMVLFPYFQERYGREESIEGMTNYVLTPMVILAGLMPIPIGSIWVCAPLFTRMVLPKFMEGVPALRILLFGTFFLALFQQSYHFLITVKKLRPLLVILAAVSGLSVALNLGFIRLGWGINGVALATSLSFFAYFIFLFLTVGLVYINRQSALRVLFQILFLFVYFTLILLALDRWVVWPGALWGVTLTQMVFYLVAMVPVVLWVHKATELARVMKSALARLPSRKVIAQEAETLGSEFRG